MRNLAVQLAGILAFAAAIAHSVLGETKVFSGARIEPEHFRRLIRLVWQCGVVAWMSLATLLIAAPSLGSSEARDWIIAMCMVTFGAGAVANAWATRGRHFGWIVLALVTGLAGIGI
jgi:hypothetical protein